MKKLERSSYPECEVTRVIAATVRQWIDGVPEIRKAFQQDSQLKAEIAIEAVLRDEFDCEVYMNDVYQVSLRRMPPNDPSTAPDMIHLSVKRRDKAPIHDWRDMQEIKNQLVGPEYEGMEMYPAESRRVDSANQYHIYCVDDPTFRWPWGFNERLVTTTTLASSVNRPFEKVEA